VRWSRDGGSLYWLTNRDSEFLRLARYDLATKEEVPFTAGIPWDIEEYDLSGNGKSIVLVANEDGLSRVHVVDAKTGQPRFTPRLPVGQISNLSFRGRSQEFAYTWSSPRLPPGVYSYDLATRWQTEWIRPREASSKAGRADDPSLIRYPTFDGLQIPAFVRRPPPSFPGPHPVLIDLHGGPDSQARPHFSSFSDYLCHELGIALIAPNVRGSSGYGRTFERLDDGRKREGAVRDVGALLDWIATQPDLDPARVAVRGGSYGGYLALATLMHYGDRLRGGIDDAGISHFETFMVDAAPVAIEGWRDEYGDEREPETIAYFRTISPLAHASQINRPLLVIHGTNDPRVRVGEADRIVAAVRRRGVPVWYVRFDGEGHNVERREHTLYAQHAQVLFLYHYLLPES
jgi:dipeptidyl aminopeptidase/acylaminoacyl peptidase